MESLNSHVQITDASDGHVFEIARIYDHYVRSETCTFELQPPTPGEMLRRMGEVLELDLPYLAAVADGRVVGYAYATRYRARPGYRHTAENSVYLDPDWRGKGVGKLLLQTLLSRCKSGMYKQMIAIVGDSRNTASIALHRTVGFEYVGTLRNVGYKFGGWLDTVVMQRAI